MKIGFITLGCKVNIYESNALKEELTSRGHVIVDDLLEADCYIINTCSVTNMADAKSRKMIHKCVKMNPNAIVCAIGCYVQTNDEAKSIDGVDIILGNGNKSKLVDLIEEMAKSPKREKKIDIIDILNNQDKRYYLLNSTMQLEYLKDHKHMNLDYIIFLLQLVHMLLHLRKN